MADESLLEPLVADQEGFEFPCDESLLLAILQLDAAEAAAGDVDGGAPHAPVEDQEVYKMKELIREKPKDVIQYLEEEGVIKLGEFDVQDAVAFRAFGKDNILTMGANHFEVDWESIWRERLAGYDARAPDVKSALGWSVTVTLEAHVVNLRDAAAEGSRGLLHPLLKRFHAHACSATVFALPAVQAVIQFKWTQWARRFLLYELACYCCWLACFTAFTLLFQAEDWSLTLWQTLQDKVGFLCVVFSGLSLLPMGVFVYMELCTIASYGWQWVRPWNVLDMASYILQVVLCVLHLQRSFVDEGWFSVLVATQQVLLWIKLHYFARAFTPTKNTIVDTIRIVMEECKWFLLFLSLTMVGFGLAFFALYRQDRNFPDFANVWHAFASMFSFMLGMFDFNVFYNSTNPTAAMLLFIAFEFFMNILLLNILIASMTNSFGKITQDEGLRLLYSKAEIIDELEATLPGWVRSGAWSPAFIHILKIHPDATYEVNLHSVESTLLGAQHETRLRVEELEDRLAKLQKKLDVLIKLHISSLGPSQALMLSRQASQLHRDGGAAGTRAATGAALRPAVWAQGRASAAAAGMAMAAPPLARLDESGCAASGSPASAAGPCCLRHALSSLPEQLTAVSGPLVGPALHDGAGHAQQQQQQQQGAVGAAGADALARGLARRSGPPALWHAGGGLLRAPSDHHQQQQQANAGDAVTLTVGRPGSSGAAGGGLRSVGSGHVATLLAQQRAWQLAQLAQHARGAGHSGGTAVPMQLAGLRGVQQHLGSLERAHSV